MELLLLWFPAVVPRIWGCLAPRLAQSYPVQSPLILSHLTYRQTIRCYVGFEVFTAVTMRYSVLFLLPRRWRWHVPPKRRFLQDPHAATSQKTFFSPFANALSGLIHRNYWFCFVICRPSDTLQNITFRKQIQFPKYWVLYTTRQCTQ
jgi:hypothetical protein